MVSSRRDNPRSTWLAAAGAEVVRHVGVVRLRTGRRLAGVGRGDAETQPLVRQRHRKVIGEPAQVGLGLLRQADVLPVPQRRAERDARRVREANQEIGRHLHVVVRGVHLGGEVGRAATLHRGGGSRRLEGRGAHASLSAARRVVGGGRRGVAACRARRLPSRREPPPAAAAAALRLLAVSALPVLPAAAESSGAEVALESGGAPGGGE